MSIAIVTGSSRGIGAAVAKELASTGCSVVVNYAASSGAADGVVAEIEATGGKAKAIQADVGKLEDVDRLFKEAAAAFPDENIEVLVNNAGITRDTLAIRMKPQQWQDVIDLNLSGVWYCSQAALKIMLKKRAGRIVNISSVVGQIGNPGQANYAAAKGGVIGMTRALAKECAPRGVTVNAVCPGFIESDMTAELPLEEITKMIPMKRLGKPTEIAGLVRYLATDASAAYTTGHTFNADGGIAIGC
ncbi:unnamed protein product [Chrysoparadoxa australica]